MNKKALITGITGQAGSYLAELLLEKGYDVHGLIRRTSLPNTSRLYLTLPRITLHEGDLTDYNSVAGIVKSVSPTEIYNLAAQSHVGSSFTQPSATFSINTIGHVNILEAVRAIVPQAKILFAATSELYGSSYSVDANGEKYQGIDTPFIPNSPYAVSKLAAFHMTRLYRECYNVNACSSIANNHESPRRGENFVTRKITKYIGGLVASGGRAIYDNQATPYPKLKLGNINAVRDWSHARDVVEAYYLMMQQEKVKDYVIGSGEAHSVKEFLEEAFSQINLCWEKYVEIDPACFRPGEVPFLRSDSSPIRKELGWKNTVNFKQLVAEMVNYDIRIAKHGN